MSRLIVLFLTCILPVLAQSKKIVVAYNDPALVEQLRSAVPQARVVPVSPAMVMTEISDADAFLGEITSAQVRAAKHLQWVGVMSAGVEQVLFPADGTSDLRQSKIVLTNNKIVQGPEIADHALAMLLMLSRKLLSRMSRTSLPSIRTAPPVTS